MLKEKDKAFYRRVANIALPILAQGLLTYLVGLLTISWWGRLERRPCREWLSETNCILFTPLVF